MTASATGSLRERLRRLLWVALAVLLVIVAVGALALVNLARTQDRLIDSLQRARIATGELESSLLDQETGVRGYALTGQPTFLAPFEDGVAAEQDAVAEIRRAMSVDAPTLDQLESVQVAARSWQDEVADVAIAQVDAGEATEAAATLEAGRDEFDELRRSLDALGNLLAERRDRLVEDTRRSLVTLGLVGVGSAVLLGSVGLAISRSLGRSVLAPLETLGSGARHVADGHLEHELTSDGPEEIRSLAESIEAMRRRITDELELIAAARADLAARSDELQRSNRDLEQFAYVASHDLQEPLRKVAGFCQLLERRYADQLDERANEYIRYAVDGAQRMQELIGDLLEFSRVGRTTERFEAVDLSDIVHAAWAESGDDDAVLVVTDLPVVEGDPTLLRTLFQNLLGNARKFRTEAPPQVEVSAERDDAAWTISVQDDGIGIDPQFEDRIFDVFQRLHTRDVFDGTGIGLALCKRIAEFHGGSIGLAPSEQGARIVVRLPFRSRLDGTRTVPSPSPPAEATT